MKPPSDPLLKKKFGKERIMIYANERTRDSPLFCRSSKWSSLSQINENIEREGMDFEDIKIENKNSKPAKKGENKE